MSTASFAPLSSDGDVDVIDSAVEQFARDYKFDQDMPANEVIVTGTHGGTRELLLRAPRGSQVIVYDDAQGKYTGDTAGR